jgi:DNA-binding response OmpR family regulator
MKKVVGGKVEPDQKIVHQALRSAGYKVEVARGADMAWEIFEEYVNG